MENFQEWLSLHQNQLESMDFPESLQKQLHYKLVNSIFDAGSSMSLFKDEEELLGSQWGLVTNIEVEPQVWLIDHLLTIPKTSQLHQDLKRIVKDGQIRKRLLDIVELDSITDVDLMATLESYLGQFEFNGKEYYYLDDEIGSRIVDSPVNPGQEEELYTTVANIDIAPFISITPNSWQSYTLAWTEDALEKGSWITTRPRFRPLRSKIRSLTKLLSNFDPFVDGEVQVLREKSFELSRILRHHGYTLDSILKKLQLDPAFFSTRGDKVIGMSFDNITSPSLVRQAVEKVSTDSPLDILIRLFCLGVPVKESQLQSIFSDTLLQWLIAGSDEFVGCHILHPTSSTTFSSLITITPLHLPLAKTKDLLIATDRHDSSKRALGSGRLFDPVMSLGVDSLGLVGLFSSPSSPVELPQTVSSILDLCSGSGVQALSLLAHFPKAKAKVVDTNPRCHLFANFNSHINFLNLEYSLASLYEEAKDDYDVLLANPPYVANPMGSKETSGKMEKFGDGGIQGDDITKEIVAGIPSSVKWCGIVANLPNPDTWLPSNSRLQLLLDKNVWSAKQYAELVSGKPEFEIALKEAGVNFVSNGFLTLSDSPKTTYWINNAWQEATVYSN